MRHLFTALGVLVFVPLFSGCATLISDPRQDLVIQTDNNQTAKVVIIQNNSRQEATVPGRFTLDHGKSRHTYIESHPCYTPSYRLEVQEEIDMTTYANLISPSGFVIDYISDAMWQYPSLVTVPATTPKPECNTTLSSPAYHPYTGLAYDYGLGIGKELFDRSTYSLYGLYPLWLHTFQIRAGLFSTYVEIQRDNHTTTTTSSEPFYFATVGLTKQFYFVHQLSIDLLADYYYPLSQTQNVDYPIYEDLIFKSCKVTPKPGLLPGFGFSIGRGPFVFSTHFIPGTDSLFSVSGKDKTTYKTQYGLYTRLALHYWF